MTHARHRERGPLPQVPPDLPGAVRATCAGPLGPIDLVVDEEHVCGISFQGQRRRLPWLELLPRDERHPLATLTRAWFHDTLAGGVSDILLPLRLRGTYFQKSVWRALNRIAPRETATYADIARAVGRPSAVRAVAAAIARNPCLIAIPCHRVIGRDGRLVGYAGGLDRKAWLLRHEQAATGTAHAPSALGGSDVTT